MRHAVRRHRPRLGLHRSHELLLHVAVELGARKGGPIYPVSRAWARLTRSDLPSLRSTISDRIAGEDGGYPLERRGPREHSRTVR